MLLNYNNKSLKEKLLFLRAKTVLKDNKISKVNIAFKEAEQFKDSLEKERWEKEYLLATVKYETKKRELELLESQQKTDLFRITKNYQKIVLFVLAIGPIATFFVL